MGFGYCKTLTPRNFSHERRLTYDITLHLRRHNEMSASPREKIKRLAVACVRRGSFISLCLYVLGLVVASLAPSLARDVYVDENAFLVGSTHATFDDLDGARADDYVETLTKITFDARSRARTTRERLEWVLNALDERGFESYKSWLDGAGDLFNVHGSTSATYKSLNAGESQSFEFVIVPTWFTEDLRNVSQYYTQNAASIIHVPCIICAPEWIIGVGGGRAS